MLIEAELPFLLVGIGVNVRHKPEVPQQGPDRGRQATCLGDFGADSTDEVVTPRNSSTSLHPLRVKDIPPHARARA